MYKKIEVKKVCAVCGKEFISHNNNAKYCCYECKKKHTREHERNLRNEKAKASNQSREHNLNQTLYNLHKYNEEHGTRLSYGQYMAKVYGGVTV